jgi:hypothetical protein
MSQYQGICGPAILPSQTTQDSASTRTSLLRDGTTYLSAQPRRFRSHAEYLRVKRAKTLGGSTVGPHPESDIINELRARCSS